MREIKKGGRYTKKVEVIKARRDSSRGRDGVCIFLKDEDGNKYKWKSSKDCKNAKKLYDERNEDKVYTMSFTVKRKGLFDNKRGKMKYPHTVYYCILK